MRASGSPLKLLLGELVLADLADASEVDHFLLFHVCEILEILPDRKTMKREDNHPEEEEKKEEETQEVRLRVRVLGRTPYSPGLSRQNTKVLEISPSQVKRRVVAVSKKDFDTLKYRDESVFYFEDQVQ
jgi:hypothetical protein